MRLNERGAMDGSRGRIEQLAKVVPRIDVPPEGRLNPRTRLGEGRVAHMASSDEVPEQASERLVFARPESRRRTFAAAERGAQIRGDCVHRDIADRPDERAQDAGVNGKHGTQRLLEHHVGLHG